MVESVAAIFAAVLEIVVEIVVETVVAVDAIVALLGERFVLFDLLLVQHLTLVVLSDLVQYFELRHWVILVHFCLFYFSCCKNE